MDTLHLQGLKNVTVWDNFSCSLLKTKCCARCRIDIGGHLHWDYSRIPILVNEGFVTPRFPPPPFGYSIQLCTLTPWSSSNYQHVVGSDCVKLSKNLGARVCVDGPHCCPMAGDLHDLPQSSCNTMVHDLPRSCLATLCGLVHRYHNVDGSTPTLFGPPLEISTI